jgi:hypothetical protein
MKFKNVFLILIYMASIANMVNPILRFQNRRLSLLYIALIMLIPIYFTIKSFKIKRLMLKVLSILSTGVLSFFSLIVLFMLFINIGMIDDMGNDPSFEWWEEIVVDEYTIDTYRINGGAMSSYGVLIRQEKPIGFGLKLVKDIYSKGRSGQPSVEWDDHVLLIDDEEFELKKSIY